LASALSSARLAWMLAMVAITATIANATAASPITVWRRRARRPDALTKPRSSGPSSSMT
jgi:hypothetical protein